MIVFNGLGYSYFDIGIKDGKVLTVESCIDVEEAEKVIDAEGGMVMPGGVSSVLPPE